MKGADTTDPFNLLGFGIVTYRDLLFQLIWLFLLLSVVALPSIYVYKAGTGYENLVIHGWESDSLGNLGYSSVQCSTIPLGVGTMTINCPFGIVGEIYDYGV